MGPGKANDVDSGGPVGGQLDIAIVGSGISGLRVQRLEIDRLGLQSRL